MRSLRIACGVSRRHHVAAARRANRMVSAVSARLTSVTAPLVPKRDVGSAVSRAAARDAVLPPTDTFPRRHIGPTEADVSVMLDAVGYASMDDFINAVMPRGIRLEQDLDFDELPLHAPPGERDITALLRTMMEQNQVKSSLIGLGFHDTITPPVIARNVLENPGWYTPYTPYQAEVSQGRMEMLLNFQTMITELTGLGMANASLLDESSAAAEAMNMCHAATRAKKNTFVVDRGVHPQTIALLQARAEPLGFTVLVEDAAAFDFASTDVFGVLVQYPCTLGHVQEWADVAQRAHAADALVVAAADLLSLTTLQPPGEWGADVCVGNSQRFGVPLGYGGPHAAFLAARDVGHVRKMPGRIIGVSRDSRGQPALRMALQTREQHIRREKATSNICTAQALLANMAAMYGIYHGPQGLLDIGARVHKAALLLAEAAHLGGAEVVNQGAFFDTVHLRFPSSDSADLLMDALLVHNFNGRRATETDITLSTHEALTEADVDCLVKLLSKDACASVAALVAQSSRPASHWDTVHVPSALQRTSAFMHQAVFNSYHSETEMLRYLFRLQSRDLGLNTSMIPLGSCTMKLNATSEMVALSWPEVSRMHPFAPLDQAQGYHAMFRELEYMLARCTGFAAVSLQPNSGATGEYAGLLAIRAYLKAQGQGHRNVCIIPTSAHGTNPASAVMAGMHVVSVRCTSKGFIDEEHLAQQVAKHGDKLACLMLTYPSTYGVFEERVMHVIDSVHATGAQVYLDGANMNAQVGLTSPGRLGADVCHLNLHKTFCIPHGGGGPGVGPIGVAAHLVPHLPSHPLVPSVNPDTGATGPITAAPWGSASINTISWMYLRMMGVGGLRKASEVAVLAANYMMSRLKQAYTFPFVSREGSLVAHEFIMDLRPFKKYGVEAEDVAKRLMDFGFHAPTMSWPVAGTLMVEPTESESLAELDRYCEALLAIRREIQDVVDGKVAAADSPLKHAPHTADMVSSDDWKHPYSRQQAAYPAPWLRQHKFWVPVSRLDNVYGDKNISESACSCDGWDSVRE